MKPGLKNVAIVACVALVCSASVSSARLGAGSGSNNKNRLFKGRYICRTTAEDEFDSTVIVIVPNGNKAGTFSYGSLNLLSDDTDFTENCGGLECACNYSLDIESSALDAPGYSGYGVGSDGQATADLSWVANPSNDPTCGPGWDDEWTFAITKNKAVVKIADQDVDGDFDNGPGECDKEPPIR